MVGNVAKTGRGYGAWLAMGVAVYVTVIGRGSNAGVAWAEHGRWCILAG